MPVTPTYPGVYIEEISSGVRTIVGVATSNTAFVGSAQRGPTHTPVQANNFGEFERNFGPLQVNHLLGYSVRQFFQNGGGVAIIVRVADEQAKKSHVTAGGLELEASGDGKWGDQIRVRIDLDTSDKEAEPPEARKLFNLFLQYKDDSDSGVEIREVFRNVSTEEDHPRFIELVLETMSMLARVVKSDRAMPARPEPNGDPPEGSTDIFSKDNLGGTHVKMEGGDNGGAIENTHIVGNETAKTGLYALEKFDLFNLLCLPPPSRSDDITADTYAKAAAYCQKRRAMLLVDGPSDWDSVSMALTGVEQIRTALGTDLLKNAAIFFPTIKVPDPLKENRLVEFAPSGAVAGICARTDIQRGVWKAPAGIEASISGANSLSVTMTDDENGRLNPLGVNCLRTFPVYGNVVWGSRTLAGADRLTSEWKYLPVRRFTLFLEESLYRGTQWVVFEPNDEPLWAQIRLNVGTFMQRLFRQGAFQGTSPSKAYFVKCDSETTPQSDIDLGIVNIHVGFAPLKPAEFVILKIQQMAGRETDT